MADVARPGLVGEEGEHLGAGLQLGHQRGDQGQLLEVEEKKLDYSLN